MGSECLALFPLARLGFAHPVSYTETILGLVFYSAASHLYSHFLEQNREFPLLLLISLGFQSLSGVGQREGVGLEPVQQHIYLPRALPVGGVLPTRLEPSQAPEEMLLKPAFTKAKPAHSLSTSAKGCFKSLWDLTTFLQAGGKHLSPPWLSQISSSSSQNAGDTAGDPPL